MQTRSLREAISEVRGTYHLYNSDTYQNIPDRLIGSLLQNIALNFIKQATDKRKLWNSPNIFQIIKCLKMVRVPLSECCGYSHPCTIARSAVQLPRIAEGTHFGMLIQGVYSVEFPNPDGTSRRFIESTPDRFANSLGMKMKPKIVHFWIQDKYLYVSDPEIEQIKISAYFEEDIPETLQPIPTNCGSTESIRGVGCCPSSTPKAENDIFLNITNGESDCCPINPYDEEFRCPGYMYEDVIKEMRIALEPYKKSQDDKTNDSMDMTK